MFRCIISGKQAQIDFRIMVFFPQPLNQDVQCSFAVSFSLKRIADQKAIQPYPAVERIVHK